MSSPPARQWRQTGDLDPPSPPRCLFLAAGRQSLQTTSTIFCIPFSNPPPSRLPGGNMTGRYRFFLPYSRMWSSKPAPPHASADCASSRKLPPSLFCNFYSDTTAIECLVTFLFFFSELRLSPFLGMTIFTRLMEDLHLFAFCKQLNELILLFPRLKTTPPPPTFLRRQ